MKYWHDRLLLLCSTWYYVHLYFLCYLRASPPAELKINRTFWFSAFENLFLDILACLSRTGCSRFPTRVMLSCWNNGARNQFSLPFEFLNQVLRQLCNTRTASPKKCISRWNHQRHTSISYSTGTSTGIQHDCICDFFVVLPNDVNSLSHTDATLYVRSSHIQIIYARDWKSILESSNPIGRGLFQWVKMSGARI